MIGSPKVRVAGYGCSESQACDGGGGEDISWVVLCFECGGADLLLMAQGSRQDRYVCTAGQRLVWRAFIELMESWAMFRGEGSSWVARGEAWWVRVAGSPLYSLGKR
jgi:hypothetical protein